MIAFDLVGLSETEAVQRIRAAKMIERVTERDGEYYIVTRDIRSDRVNLAILRGKVIGAEIG